MAAGYGPSNSPLDHANAWPTLPKTKVLPVSISDLGTFKHDQDQSFLHKWSLSLADSDSGRNLAYAAKLLQSGDSPVAFPTETVYGLGADATSSKAVQGIYKAKNRPSDNPLIVHFCHLDQLRTFLDPAWSGNLHSSSSEDRRSDPIPKIYHEPISRFWPGPLTILLPLPSPSPLAPEVTNSLQTFGARLPSSVLALALIYQTGRPLAAPSANASTRPSPTAAQHVLEDMDGRIEAILDGGACNVGVESTVIDGLSNPPCVLRPGGIGIEELRSCPGWEDVVNGYKQTERSHVNTPDTELQRNGYTNAPLNAKNGEPQANGDAAPRAPGMKYRHYAPRAQVLLVEHCAWQRLPQLIQEARSQGKVKIGIMSTRSRAGVTEAVPVAPGREPNPAPPGIYEAFIGPTIVDVSRGLFGALRDLDACGVDVIFAEARESGEGQTSEAVMNRLRKAAETVIKE